MSYPGEWTSQGSIYNSLRKYKVVAFRFWKKMEGSAGSQALLCSEKVGGDP
jgi:hypothetical protein